MNCGPPLVDSCIGRRHSGTWKKTLRHLGDDTQALGRRHSGSSRWTRASS
ncbi:hypothetical protein DEO72_LG2g3234 [Vigna unguiculata]|uniref:Uncharacterized protein n=1 Tax=Vigna unguiculata TaxID=3917 RepID=A0A4D6L301_VIGUN|nr:hypothetical protein DEO72_LG2g3234 [Vigna unguiculata]